MSKTPDIKLGLIGDNIAGSSAPVLHQLAGQQNAALVQYDRLVPKDMGEDFDAVFDKCAERGYRGINVTYPYKERVVTKVQIDDPMVAAIGAVNTVLFEADGKMGLNTDYTGFMSAYRTVREEQLPGICCLIGTGGVGRAIAFGLIELGAQELRLVDRDRSKAEALCADLTKLGTATNITVWDEAIAAASGATGVLNATPIGMVGYDGTALPAEAMQGASWAFDAVYTPVNTEFLNDAATAGLTVISGYELFIYQGVHAWKLFSGKPLDEAALRTALIANAKAAQ